MDEPAPKEGAGTDESHRTGSCCGRQDSPGGTPLGRGNVRASSSNAHQYQLSAREATGLTRTQNGHLADDSETDIKDSRTCQAHSCWESGSIVEIEGDDVDDAPVLCETHRRAYLGVSS